MYSAGYKLNEIYSFVKMFVQKDIKSMKNEVTWIKDQEEKWCKMLKNLNDNILV